MPRALVHLALMLAPILVGVLLVWLSVPKIPASIAKAPAVAALTAVRRGELVANENLAAAIEGLHLSLAAERHPQVLRDLGLLELVLADGLDAGSEQRARLLAASRANLAESLARAPASPHAWTRMAYVELASNGPTAGLGRLIANSFYVGRAVPELTFPRLELLLTAWADLPSETRIIAGELVREAWLQDAGRVSALADRQRATGMVRFALSPVPGAKSEFDRMLARN